MRERFGLKGEKMEKKMSERKMGRKMIGRWVEKERKCER